VFKTKANAVAKVLAEAGIQTEINTQKPRRGAFVIAIKGSSTVELLDLKRPFAPLRAMDVEDMVAKVKEAASTAAVPPASKKQKK
jgi:hypothetical protein